MDLSLLEPKEIVAKLYEVSSEIITLYNKMIRGINEENNSIEGFGLITKLKLLILKERAMIISIPREKILLCYESINFGGIQDEDLDFCTVGELGRGDFFKAPENDDHKIILRVHHKLYEAKQQHSDESISYTMLGGGGQQTVHFGREDAVNTLINIIVIKDMQKQLEDCNDPSIPNLNMELSKRLKVLLRELLMTSSALEYLTFIFNPEPSIDSSIDNSLELLRLILMLKYKEAFSINVGNLGDEVIFKLSEIDIDVSLTDFSPSIDFDSIFKLFEGMTRLGVLLSYADKEQCEKFMELLDSTKTMDYLIDTLYLEELHGDIDSFTSLPYIQRMLGAKFVDFKSSSIEKLVRDKLKKGLSRFESK